VGYRERETRLEERKRGWPNFEQHIKGDGEESSNME
jgi:hypothetical protein